MNRFIIGGVLAGLVLMLMSGLSRLSGDRPDRERLASQQNTTAQDADGLGALPLEQAGQLVQRQSEVGTGTAAAGNSAFTDQGNNRATISPNNTGTPGANGVTPAPGNVIPRTGAATTYPATGGDIAPIQPGLVQPDAAQRPAPNPDPDLDSIPALW
ncbi:hypothetical protein H6F75_06225 [Nodosilinea sp. FACHB-131]|uniref:hypothetical protein n=1 Tax=Cyanophyceae TaxID=3028117 RepID=UPI0016864C03|nr:hypothetical protein [Nodosilinea sp. FACHB-131]MBD1873070.1 hypothetical protein [Nodosilinea sp. FACHB-131]